MEKKEEYLIEMFDLINLQIFDIYFNNIDKGDVIYHALLTFCNPLCKLT